MKKTLISIVVPVFNEKESLPELVKSLDEMAKKTNDIFEYIFVDDGSTDRSFDALIAIKEKFHPPMILIRFRKHMGKSAALACGFQHVAGEKVIMMDADLQDDPNEIPKLIEKLDEGYDLVVGWRKERKDPKGKIRVSHFFNNFVSTASGVSLHDMNCGLKAFKREVIEEIHLYGELHRFIPLLVARRGFRITEVPVIHHPRKFGDSKYGAERVFHAFFDIITTLFISSFETRPIKLFGSIGSVFAVIGIIFLIYLSFLHFLGQSIGRRPLLFFGILLVLFGVQLFSTGLLGELILSLHAGKENYPIEKIEK